MKKSLIMASLLVASTSMMAMDSQYFLGAGATRIDADYKTTLDYSFDEESGSYSETDSFKDTGLTLKAGVILNKNHRISVVYSDYSKEDVDATTVTGNYDYLIPLNNQFMILQEI